MKRYIDHNLLFGLSANPVHFGHINLVIHATKQLGDLNYHVKKITIIPVYRRNPTGGKTIRLEDTYQLRYQMCLLASEIIKNKLDMLEVEVSTIEKDLVAGLQTPNYTAMTLTELRKRERPDVGLIWLSGIDYFSGKNPDFSKWYSPEKIVELAILAVTPRPGYKVNDGYIKSLEQQGAKFIILDLAEQMEVSASTIRQRLLEGENPSQLVKEDLIPQSIGDLIQQAGLVRIWRESN